MTDQSNPQSMSNPPSVLVIGFNVRPLARSAKKAGFRVLAVDYWGDLDLPQWADFHLAVLDQQPEQRPDRPEIPTAKVLVTGTKQILKQYGSVQHILVSGGFDDHPELWGKLTKLGNLAGNSVKVLRKARDRSLLYSLAKKVGAAVPISFEAKNRTSYQRAVNRLELPIVVKPKAGSGGFHSRILRTEEEVDSYANRHQFDSSDPILIQELIQGTDASVSILGTEKKAVSISVNEQLIGIAELGKGRTKAYCGNIVPLDTKPRVLSKLRTISEIMATELGLIGSNGFDFVVDSKGLPYFMEINPRFQATIEAIELVTNYNLVTLNLDACHGQIPEKIEAPRATCVRIIVYARTPCIIPNFSSIPGVVDIPVPNSHAERGDPICTVNHIGPNRTETLENAWAIVNTIYSQLIPISDTP